MGTDKLTAADRAQIENYLSKPPYDRDFSDLIPDDGDDEAVDDDAEFSDGTD